MKLSKVFLAAIFAMVLVRPNSAVAVDLDEALTSYLQSSPLIRAQSRLVDLAGGDRWRRFLIHEPQAQITNADDSASVSYGLSLTTPFPGKSFALMQTDRAKFEAEQSELQAKRYELSKTIASAYLECATNRELMGLQKNAVEDFGTLAGSLQMLYEAGHSTQAERIGAQLQFRQASADLESLESHSEEACRKWFALIGPETDQNLPTSIPDDLKDSTLAAIGAATADQARGTAQLNLAETSAKLRWWNQAPDLTWSVNRNHYLYAPASPSGRDWTTSVTVGVTLPLFFPFTESVEAKRTLEQATIDQTAALIQVASANVDRQGGALEFRRSQRRLKVLRERDIPLAEALVESTYAAYKSGKLGYAELILSRKTYLDLKTQEIQLRGISVQSRLRCLDQCETVSLSPAEK
jgi:outer membrane protein TolC